MVFKTVQNVLLCRDFRLIASLSPDSERVWSLLIAAASPALAAAVATLPLPLWTLGG